jgi:adenylosuccinate lyase
MFKENTDSVKAHVTEAMGIADNPYLSQAEKEHAMQEFLRNLVAVSQMDRDFVDEFLGST